MATSFCIGSALGGAQRLAHTHRPRSHPPRSSAAPVYPYNDSDGKRQKATIEHIFTPGEADGAPSTSGSDASDAMSSSSGTSSVANSSSAPWMGWMMNERNLVWHDDLKLDLIKRAASDELGIDEEEVEARLQVRRRSLQPAAGPLRPGMAPAEPRGRCPTPPPARAPQVLANLLPDLSSRLAKMPARTVTRLLAGAGQVALRLIRLRAMLPEADVSQMVGARLSLLLDDDLDEVEAGVARLRQLLPGISVDRCAAAWRRPAAWWPGAPRRWDSPGRRLPWRRADAACLLSPPPAPRRSFAEAFPVVLDAGDFEAALQDARRLMPGADVEALLRSNPDLVLSLIKGKNLIPYDQLDNPTFRS
jgi:hypothetical protein